MRGFGHWIGLSLLCWGIASSLVSAGCALGPEPLPSAVPVAPIAHPEDTIQRLLLVIRQGKASPSVLEELLEVDELWRSLELPPDSALPPELVHQARLEVLSELMNAEDGLRPYFAGDIYLATRARNFQRAIVELHYVGTERADGPEEMELWLIDRKWKIVALRGLSR